LLSLESAQSTTVGDKVVPLAGTEAIEAFDTIVLAVGEEADLEFLAGTPVRAGQRIATAAVGRTTAPGVFACGDVAFGYGTVTQAIASGRKTAEAVAQYLEFIVQTRKNEKP
jgi:NADPH-dependent glutamate synthase beta subunit-like oxidoreductase